MLFVFLKWWVAPPRRQLYHRKCPVRRKSFKSLFKRKRCVAGDTLVERSPGCSGRTKERTRPPTQESSRMKDSHAPTRCPLLVSGSDHAPWCMDSKDQSALRAWKSSPERGYRWNPKMRSTPVSFHPKSKALWANAFAILGVKGAALRGSSARVQAERSRHPPAKWPLQLGMTWPKPDKRSPAQPSGSPFSQSFLI